MSAAEGQIHDDVDTCRICSMPSEDDRPLFYPCKCSGTIKYIHQDCLTTWLEHSKKRSCDVCKHQYAFTNVYSQDMPQRLPAHLVAKRVLRQSISAVILFLRASLVSLVWLAFVPYVTVITWRTYFWFGDVIAWWINARPMPEALEPPLGTLAWLGNLTTFILDADADAVDLHVSRETAQGIARSISTDIFTGQIIATMIVLVFLCVFLLREWIMQNARPGLFEEAPLPDEPLALEPAEPAAPPPAPDPAPLDAAVEPPRAPTPLGEPPANPHTVAIPAASSNALPRASPTPTLRSSDSDADDEEGRQVLMQGFDSPIGNSGVEFSPREHRKGKTGSFDASREAWLAFKARQHDDPSRSSDVPGASSGAPVGPFDWQPLQEAALTPQSGLTEPDVSFIPLRSSTSQSSASASTSLSSSWSTMGTSASQIADNESAETVGPTPALGSPHLIAATPTVVPAAPAWTPDSGPQPFFPSIPTTSAAGKKPHVGSESFDRSRQSWLAFKAKQLEGPRASTSQGSPSAGSGVSVAGFDWGPLQDAPLSMPSTSSQQDVPFTPLRSSMSRSSASSFASTPPAAIAPHSAATSASPAVDDELARVQIPPFTPSAFHFVVDPGPSTPSTLADSPEQESRPGMAIRTGALSPFSGDFPRSGAGSSPALETSSTSSFPFTPGALRSSGDEGYYNTNPWSNAPSLFSPGPSAVTSESSPLHGASTSYADSTSPALPPFTPSLFTFQGTGSSPGGVPETGTAPESATAEKPSFMFTFAQDVPGSASFRLAAARRPGLAPATPSEEIPIALYRAPEELETLEEESRKRRRSSPTAAQMDHYFTRGDRISVTSTAGTDADEVVEEERVATGHVRFDSEGELIPDLEVLTDTDMDSDFGEFDDVDDEENDDDWEDMDDGPADRVEAGEGQAGAEAAPVDGDVDGAVPPAEVNADEDLDGALEAVGMRGPIVIIFQNAAIAAVLLDVAIALGIWVPYTMGKTAGLLTLNPRRALTLLNMPIRAVRYVTDPVVDFCATTTTNFIAPVLLFIPRFTRFLLVGAWFVASRLYIQVADVVGRSVLGADRPTLRDREMVLRVRDQALVKLLHPNFSVLTDRLANTTAWLFTKFQPAAVVNTTTEPTLSSMHRAMELIKKLPVNQTVAEDYLHSVQEFGARSATRWVAHVEGDGTVERVFAITLGYSLMLLAAACYLNTFTSANARSAGRAARNAVIQQLVVLKVAMFIVIELLMFPVGCGILLDIGTLPLFPETTIQSRLMFLGHSPLTSIFSHWLLGTTFMYQFAIMLSAFRTVIRPGAMWFVKDPQDPAAHPIRDIIDRPATSQLRKLGISMIMYMIVIGVGFGGLIVMLLTFCSDVFPLRWNLREPLSEVPIDLLFAHFVLPATFKYMRIKSTARVFLEYWWRFMSHQLRLTSFMYGGRHPSEEYTPPGWSWTNPFNVGEAQQPEGIALDGGFRRVPATDHVALPKGKTAVVVRTDADGNPLSVEGAAIIAAQVAEAEEAKRDPKEDYTVVYVPPHFRWRIIVFLLSFWLTSAIAIVFAFSFPIRVGRAIIAICTERILHDVYAFTIGAYALTAGWLVGTELPTAARPWTFVRRFLLWAPQAAYMFVAVGVVLPTLLAILVDLYLTLPLRMWLFPATQPVIRIAHCWAIGLLMARIVLWTHRLPRVDRVNELEVRGVMQAWQVIERNGLLAPDVVGATRDFILPVGLCLASAIVIPAVVFVVAQQFMPVPIPAKLLPQAVYVSIFAITCVSGLISSIAENASSWMQGVRDQEFLVERRLRNLENRK